MKNSILLVLAFAALVTVAGSTAAGEAAPKMELVQTIKNGTDGVAKMNGIFSLAVAGDYLYVGAGEDGTLLYFKRDLKLGTLAYAGTLEVGKKLANGFPQTRKWGHIDTHDRILLAVMGGRLYVLPGDGTALGWYELDPRTGAPQEKGLVECPPARQIAVSPDQHDLYIKYQQQGDYAGVPSILWFHLDAGGKPVRAGEVVGKGIDWDHWNTLAVSPDGKNLYSFNDFENSIAVLDRKPNGAIALSSVLDVPQSKFGKHCHMQWTTLGLTPDGQWLFAAGAPKGMSSHQQLVFKRDPATGTLAFQEAVTDGPKGRQLLFAPDGSGGFLASLGALESFTFNAKTGHTTQISRLAEADGQAPLTMCYDAQNGLLYAGTYKWGYPDPSPTIKNQGDQLFVIRTEKSAAAK